MSAQMSGPFQNVCIWPLAGKEAGIVTQRLCTHELCPSGNLLWETNWERGGACDTQILDYYSYCYQQAREALYLCGSAQQGNATQPQGRHSTQRQRNDSLGVPVREGLQPRLQLRAVCLQACHGRCEVM